MLYSLLHGDLGAAVGFNALGLIALILLAWSYSAWSYGRLRGRTVPSWQHHRWAPALTLTLVSVWFLLRNLPFEPFSALHV